MKPKGKAAQAAELPEIEKLSPGDRESFARSWAILVTQERAERRQKSELPTRDQAARFKQKIEELAAMHGMYAADWPFAEAVKERPELGVLLGKYAVLLERECDELRSVLEGVMSLPPEKRRSTVAPPKRLPPPDKEERAKRAKQRHDEDRARKRGGGRIESLSHSSDAERGKLLGAFLSESDGDVRLWECPELAKVSAGRARQNDLCEFFGHNRKDFPRIPKLGRIQFYGWRKFFLIAEHLLRKGTWPPNQVLRLRFIEAVERTLQEDGCPRDFFAAGKKFTAAARRAVRESQ